MYWQISYLAYLGIVTSELHSLYFFLIFLAIMILGILKIRKNQKGVISFTSILVFCTSITLIAMMISTVGDHLYWMNMSEESQQTYINEKADRAILAIENKGTLTAQKEDEIMDKTERHMTLEDKLQELVLAFPFVVIISVILGLIFKKDETAV